MPSYAPVLLFFSLEREAVFEHFLVFLFIFVKKVRHIKPLMCLTFSLSYLRPYHAENNGYHPTTEIEPRRSWLVLGRVSSGVVGISFLVLHTYFIRILHILFDNTLVIQRIPKE